MKGIISSNKGKYQDYSIINDMKELMFTPDDTASEIMSWISPQIPIEDSVLESFKGNGVFYDKIPNKKYYCEIDNGIDFFKYDKKVDWVISNPPFRVMYNNEVINAFVLIINKTMELCNKGFFYLINHKLWSSITVKRLREWSNNKWVISAIKIIEIKKWYGRYYIVKFEKNGESIFDFGKTNKRQNNARSVGQAKRKKGKRDVK